MPDSMIKIGPDKLVHFAKHTLESALLFMNVRESKVAVNSAVQMRNLMFTRIWTLTAWKPTFLR